MPSYFYDLNRNSSIWNNSGDSIYLSNGTDTCKLSYTSSKGNGCAVIVSGSNSTVTTNDCTLSPTDLGTGPLPAELVEFSVVLSDNRVLLNWKTASELNNNYFSIEKSSIVLEFYAIGREIGAGTSNEINEYSFHDEWIPDYSYYRLKQTDFNGKYSYPEILKIEASFTNFNIVEGQERIRILNKDEDDLSYLLTSQSGQVMESGEESSSFVISKNKLMIGFYVLQVSNRQGIETKKIVVR
jgi:hypothetical protein